MINEYPTFSNEIVVHWFRRDLRIDDNAALVNAMESGLPVLPVFIFDTNIISKLEHDDRRISFIYKAISELHLRLIEFGSGLQVFHGEPLEILRQLVDHNQVRAVYTNDDYEPYARERDDKVSALLSAKGIVFMRFKDQVIFEKNEMVKLSGEPYTVFTPYADAWMRKLSEHTSSLEPYRIPKQGAWFVKFASKPLFPLPAIGFTGIPVVIEPSINEREIVSYHETRNFPALESTSRLGVHLRFGTISIRKVVLKAMDLNETWLKELIWREFFMQILWHFPHVVTKAFKPQFENISWNNDASEFEKWCEGRTGFPMVDAGMRELNETGFMHNRVRMVTASFLAKHLLIDWRWGEAYFASKLLDFEQSSNNGNWQWVAGTGCDAAPYFRIFNPATQALKFDKDEIYVRRWIPEYGTPGYPAPVVEHEFARRRCLNAYNVARQSYGFRAPV